MTLADHRGTVTSIALAYPFTDTGDERDERDCGGQGPAPREWGRNRQIERSMFAAGSVDTRITIYRALRS